MARYYVNKNPQTTGEHEVHRERCTYMPEAANREYLGDFINCSGAVGEAKKWYSSVDGCYYCCKACHTR